MLLAGALWFHILLDLNLLALHPLIGSALYSLQRVPPLQPGLMYVVEAVSRYVAERGGVVRGWRGGAGVSVNVKLPRDAAARGSAFASNWGGPVYSV